LIAIFLCDFFFWAFA
jgi:hypothetical protein